MNDWMKVLVFVKMWMSVQWAVSPAILMPAAPTLLVVMTVNADLGSLKMVQLAWMLTNVWIQPWTTVVSMRTVVTPLGVTNAYVRLATQEMGLYAMMLMSVLPVRFFVMWMPVVIMPKAATVVNVCLDSLEMVSTAQILMNVQVQITVAQMLTALTTSEAMIVPVLLVMLVMDIRVMILMSVQTQLYFRVIPWLTAQTQLVASRVLVYQDTLEMAWLVMILMNVSSIPMIAIKTMDSVTTLLDHTHVPAT
jgi:hypothetical protein